MKKKTSIGRAGTICFVLWTALLAAGGVPAARAQTVEGNYSIRFPSALPFLHGYPDLPSAPLLGGGNVGGAAAVDTSLLSTSLVLKSSAFGHAVEHLIPNNYLGDILDPPALTNGASVNWALMTNTAYVDPSGSAFFEPSVCAMYASAGGEVSITWQFTDGTEVETTYIVEAAPAGRPYRVYWTDRGAPKVQFSDNTFVKFHYNAQITAPVWSFSTNNGIVISNITAGLYIDSAKSLNAVGEQRGMIVMQYFKNGNFDEQVSLDSVIVIEVLPPDQQTLSAGLGERLLPQGGWSAAAELYPQITEGLLGDDQYVVQHLSSDGSTIPKMDWVFPVRACVDSPWNIEVYWKIPDLMGTEWFYEVDWYAADWEACYRYVSGDGTNAGVPIYFPSNLTATLMPYEEPEDGCAELQNLNTLVATTNDGKCLVQLVSADENIWFLPISITSRRDPEFDLLPRDWTIGEELRPFDTARSVWFPEGTTGRVTTTAMNLPGDFTLEGWFKPGNLATITNAYITLFDKNVAGGPAWSNQINVSLHAGVGDLAGTLRAVMGSGRSADPYLITLISSNTLSSHEWAHVAVTLDDYRLTLYVNGVRDRSALLGTNGTRQTGATPLCVGDVRSGAAAPFDGFVDNLRVWDCALNPSQVQDAMNGNYLGMSMDELKLRGLIAYFPVNEDDTQSTLQDLVGAYSAAVTNALLPDVGAVGMRDSILYSEYHGYVYPPVGVCYNTNLYQPASGAAPNAESFIYAVNTNSNLEVWWSLGVRLPDMPSTVYIPNWVERYRNRWPEPGECPHIVLASGQGSRQGGLFNSGYCLSLTNAGTAGHAVLRKGAYFSGDFSLGLWVWLAALPSAGQNATLFDVHNTTAATAHVDAVSLSVSSAGGVTLLTQNGSTTNVLSGILTTGKWTYVLATVKSGEAFLYVDNKQTNFSALLPVPADVTRTNCYIGYHGAGSVEVKGRVDELRIWNTVLTESERAAAMYNDSERLNTDNLTAYFPFDPFHGRLIENRVNGQRALMINSDLNYPGAPALGSRLYFADQNAGIYYQNDAALPGYNPNEEHALVTREGGYDVVYALRDDLNDPFGQSQPFVLVNHVDPDTGRRAMDVLYVVRTNEVYSSFVDAAEAGQPMNGPHPLDLLPAHWTGADIKESGPGWKGRDKAWYAVAGGATLTGSATVILHNYYPMQSSFWFPGLTAAQQPALNTPIPWLPALAAQDYRSTTYPTSGMPVAVRWETTWPAEVPKMDVGETLLAARDGLPDIWNQLSVDVTHQQSILPGVESGEGIVEVYDPICARGVNLTNSLDDLGFELGGRSPSIYMRNGMYYFNNLPPDLSGRFYYDPTRSSSNLIVVGSYINPVTGDDYVMMNELSARQRVALTALVASNNPFAPDWARAIGQLATDYVPLPPNRPFTGIALHAPGKNAGYVTLAFNNATNPAMGVSAGDPISFSIIEVTTNLAVGSIIPMEDEYNLLSRQMTMLYTLDFAGDPGKYEFDWRWSEPNANGTTPAYPEACDVYTNGIGLNSVVLDGSSVQDLINRFFAVRYRAISNTVENVVGTNWSAFCSFSLSEGWVQRILNAITPFEQRMRDLYANAVEDQIDMIGQAGPPFEGRVALNQDNLGNVGLIQLYETVKEEASEILDAHPDDIDAAANQQLLLAASRLNDLYMLLGNEAYADAQDPTIGFGSTMVVNGAPLALDYGSLASSIFCFDNQVATLLEEELALLRGRGNPALAPGMGVSPVYNRLYWNYTRGIKAGEVAYSVQYDILGHTNVVIDEATAAVRYPQGHGDAWGYYLDAVKCYYRLLMHPTFDWGMPSISPLLLGDLTIDADYYDERKFAEAGAALARSGADILQQTYRQAYQETQDSLQAGYVDANTNRAWGVGEWGSRVGVGALCNWMVGNSLLPLPSAWLTNSASLALDGAGYAAGPRGVYFAGDFTIEMWVNVHEKNIANWVTLADFANSNFSERVRLLLHPTNRAVSLSIVNSTTGTLLSTDAGLATGQWIHVAAVLAGDQAGLYLNGSLAKQAAGQAIPSTVYRTNCFIGVAGKADWLNEMAFSGFLSDIRIWSAARSAADIADAMSERLKGGESDLAAYWPLNEGKGSILFDRSYSGLNARGMDLFGWTNRMPDLAANYDYDDPSILKIDRASVAALAELAENMNAAQTVVNNADRGLNPLGLAQSAIPFDISPAGLDEGSTHFEQILARAEAALNNAGTVFDYARDAGRLLRQQQQNAQSFQEAVNNQEASILGQLIELYGYPYSDDIGAGKTYPAGYSGPDLYHYMYVDMAALGWSGTDIEPLYAVHYAYVGERDDLYLKAFGYDTNAAAGTETEGVTNIIRFTLAANGLPCKPSEFTGTRLAEGRIQKSYNEFLKQLLGYRKALDEYIAKTEYLNEYVEWYVDQYYQYKHRDNQMAQTVAYMKEEKAILEAVLNIRKTLLKVRKEVKQGEGAVEQELVPMDQVAGAAVGGDIFAGVRDAIVALNETASGVISVRDAVYETIGIVNGVLVESLANAAELTKLIDEFNLDMIEKETEIGELVRQQKVTLDAVQIASEGLRQAYQDMLAVEQEGQRILSGRERVRKESANRIASMRYSDMTFRLFRNEALSRYRSAFDVAARYAYLAAKAYDYETGLLSTESATDPGSRFLSSVVKARSIGRIDQGEPQVGGSIGDPGLADILARMKANWVVLDGRLGFNNPDRETSRFSLRTELFRILPGSSGDANWRQALEACKVDNLFDVPEFRRYCIPFASGSGLRPQEPGFVIPFSTTVDFGYNFFGHELAGGDNAYDSSHFATKIRSVGVWFSNYNPNVTYPGGLQNTPAVYLVPAGVDTIRSPTDLTGGTLRSWLVQDQAIPVPYAIGDDDMEDADWLALYDSLPGSLAALRRFSSMRAYHDGGSWDSSQLNYNSRLIGRSVWNSKWYLIIPAGTLSSDRRLAMEVFIYGVNGNGDGIKDIRLFFETYSYSGN